MVPMYFGLVQSLLDHTSVARRFVLGLAILACDCAGKEARWGKMSPVQDLNAFRPRHHRGEIATPSAPVRGVFRPRISPPESEVRRVTLRVGRVSHGSLIIHARVIIHFFTAGVHSRVFEFPRS